MTNISPEEFNNLENEPLLIDVRSQLEYRLFHAPLAINLSLPLILLGEYSFLRRWLLPKWFQELPKNQPIAVICLTAHRSPLAAKSLVKAGFKQVYNITGGMVQWKKLGLPTIKGKQESILI